MCLTPCCVLSCHLEQSNTHKDVTVTLEKRYNQLAMILHTDGYLSLNGIISRVASQSTRNMKLNSKSQTVTR